jgi:hypothetical protein
MRFRTTDAALEAITTSMGGAELLDPADVVPTLGENWAGNDRYDDMDKRHVGWEAIGNITRPDVYRIARQPGPDGWQWYGFLVVDPVNHRAFVHASGD